MTEVQRLAKIKVLKGMLKEYELLAKYNGGTDYDRWNALDMAIKALEQEPKTEVLDKIRAEIEHHRRKTQSIDPYNLVGDCLEIIDKYKAESEDKE